MSSTEPPEGSTPPSGEPTPPPPPPNPSTVPPPDPAMAPPPPPPPAGAAAPAPGVPGAGYGAGQPGNLLDRFLARLIDGIIVGVVIAILNFILQAGMSYWTATFISGVIGAVLVTGYFVYFESERGQTVGKQVMKLKTVGPDGQSNPTVNEALKRNIWNAFQIVPCLGPLAALASVILIAIGINGDPVNRQHWFDKFAGGTKVLKVG